jgi:hypothetical protein
VQAAAHSSQPQLQDQVAQCVERVVVFLRRLARPFLVLVKLRLQDQVGAGAAENLERAGFDPRMDRADSRILGVVRLVNREAGAAQLANRPRLARIGIPRHVARQVADMIAPLTVGVRKTLGGLVATAFAAAAAEWRVHENPQPPPWNDKLNFGR